MALDIHSPGLAFCEPWGSGQEEDGGSWCLLESTTALICLKSAKSPLFLVQNFKRWPCTLKSKRIQERYKRKRPSPWLSSTGAWEHTCDGVTQQPTLIKSPFMNSMVQMCTLGSRRMSWESSTCDISKCQTVAWSCCSVRSTFIEGIVDSATRYEALGSIPSIIKEIGCGKRERERGEEEGRRE